MGKDLKNVGSVATLPDSILKAWSEQVVVINDFVEAEVALFELTTRKLTKVEYEKRKAALECRITELEESLREGENSLFVAVNNFMVCD